MLAIGMSLAYNNAENHQRKKLKSEYKTLLWAIREAKIRENAKWWEKRERSTDYFLILEEQSRQANNVKDRIRIVCINGTNCRTILWKVIFI